MKSHLTRRMFLKLALASLTSAACAPTQAVLPISVPVFAPPTQSEPPTVTPTPLPSADGTVAAFLTAWTNSDYAAMYELLIEADRSKLSLDDFQTRYTDVLREATASGIKSELRSILNDVERATASFHADWQTAMFGRLGFDGIMPLNWEGGHWAIDWSSHLVHPQLNDDYTLVRLDQVPVRGNIYDRNGLGLAVEGQMVTIGVVPGWVEDMAHVLATLSAITGASPDAMRTKIANARPEWFVPLVDVSPELSIANDEALSSLKGVVRRDRKVRAYRTGTLAAHLLGYMGAIPPQELADWQARGYRGDELVGRSGVEGWGEPYLAGRRGGRLVILTPQNQEVARLAEATPRPGDSIHLTIDKGLQADAENILGQRQGAMVVLDPNTGFVLAMASYPRFDPNLFVKGIDEVTWNRLTSDPGRPLVERCSQGAYPTGSVFKIVTITAGMEKLGLTADTTYTCTGSWDGLGGGFVKTCWKREGHGVITLQEGLTQSCDVVFYNVGLALQNKDANLLPAVARQCGLGKPTGIGAVQENAGQVPDPDWKLNQWGEGWVPGDTVNLAIGQGFLLTTPLQVAVLISAVANGGILYRPQLVSRIVERGGTERVSQPEVMGQLPTTPEQLAIIRTALEGVVTRGTAAFVFKGAKFTAAGKTGTAETGQENPHAWFTGYVPVDAPQLAIAVIVEESGEGSEQAAPLFRQMVEAYFARQSPAATPTPGPAPASTPIIP